MTNYYFDLNEEKPTENPEVTDVNSIVQNVLNLILTPKRTRMFDPEYGVDLDEQLFELFDDASALEIFNSVTDAVRKYEPRVILDFSQSDVTADPDNNSYEVKLFFQIQGFNEDGKLFSVTTSLTR